MHLSDNDARDKKIGEALTNYSNVFDLLSLVPLVGLSASELVKSWAEKKGESLLEVPDINESKVALEQALVESKRKIVVVIDDIDRLTNSQIRDIFQLVKQVGNFPNIIYVLAMDKDVVCKALAEVHNLDGNEYLEKIIQIPLEVPEIRRAKLHTDFSNKLEKTMRPLIDGRTY